MVSYAPVETFQVKLESLTKQVSAEERQSPTLRSILTIDDRTHESYTMLDAVLHRNELRLIDEIIRFGYSPLSLHTINWFESPRLSPPRRVDSRVTRSSNRKIMFIVKCLGFNLTRVNLRQKLSPKGKALKNKHGSFPMKER